jgi:hypothetical protein
MPSPKPRAKPRLRSRSPSNRSPALADLNPSWSPKPHDGPSRAGVCIAKYAAFLLADTTEPSITTAAQVIDGCAEALLTLVAMTPVEIRHVLLRRVLRQLEASERGAFEAVDKARRPSQEAPQ